MDLSSLREDLNTLDAEIVERFVLRMDIAEQVAAYKRENGLPVLDAAREEQVLGRVEGLAGLKYGPYARTLYQTMMGVSRAYQQTQNMGETPLETAVVDALAHMPDAFPTRGVVACQGIEGAYGQQAVEKLFAEPSIVYCRTFEAVFQAVESGLCDFGVLPIENSSFGSVASVYDLMYRHKFHIVRATRLMIEHKLLAKPGAKLSGIREIVSHEQAIGQCSAYLSAHPEIKVTVCENTAVAARRVAESDRSDIAAISSPQCATLYSLVPLLDDVQNAKNNQTRFICIARDLTIYPGADRVSMQLATPHTAGSLERVLARFASMGINLAKLESRPIPDTNFDFLFYLDIEASLETHAVLRLLGELSLESPLFTLLGCYGEA